MHKKGTFSSHLCHNQNTRMEPEGTLTTRRQFAPRLCSSMEEVTALYTACSAIVWDKPLRILVHNEDKQQKELVQIDHEGLQELLREDQQQIGSKLDDDIVIGWRRTRALETISIRD